MFFLESADVREVPGDVGSRSLNGPVPARQPAIGRLGAAGLILRSPVAKRPPEARNEAVKEVSERDMRIIDVSISESLTGIDFKGKDVEKKIEQLLGNSLNFDFSPYFGKMDIVFIDGAHHYEAVKSDTANALKMVRPGGFIIWHDFASYGDYNDVTRAIMNMMQKDEFVQIENSRLAVYRHH